MGMENPNVDNGSFTCQRCGVTLNIVNGKRQYIYPKQYTSETFNLWQSYYRQCKVQGQHDWRAQ